MLSFVDCVFPNSCFRRVFLLSPNRFSCIHFLFKQFRFFACSKAGTQDSHSWDHRQSGENNLFFACSKAGTQDTILETIETRAKTSLICVSRHFETSLENKPICLNKRRVDSIRSIAAKVFRLVLRHRRLFHAALPHIACVAALPHIMGGHACELCFSHSRTMRLMRSICDDQELVFFNPVERRWLDKTSLGLADKNHNI